MNEQHIEEIITALYDLVQDARALPLGADKCILERDKVLDMLDEIIAQMPAELKQARTIVENRADIVAQAKREAESIVRKAQEDADKLVSKEAVYEEAKRRCAEEIAQTKSQIANLRKVSNEYMDDALRRTEEAIAQGLSEVQETRAKFNALAAAQMQRDAESAEN
jgi:F0F1-type ATP synthase membrane subunit b/b'